MFVIGSQLVTSGKKVWVDFQEPSLGTPEYNYRFELLMTPEMKLALLKFSDPQSCVSDAALVEPSVIVKIDWDKIETTNEASICIFRLLSVYGNLSMSDEWFNSHGFRVAENSFSAKTPHIERDGSLRVTGYWSVKNDGPLFPTSGFFRRVFASIPYAMSVSATWTEDGETLKWIGIDFSTL